MGDDTVPSSTTSRNGSSSSELESDEEPLDPSGIAQFVRHDRCPRYLKQRFEPGSEPDAREWREAFNVVNPALMGSGQEFEATQIEALAANATKIIGPECDDGTKAGVPDIIVDETWEPSTEGRRNQFQAALNAAATLQSTTEKTPYILCYQVPLGGTIGDETLWGEVDCLVLAPTAATDVSDQTTATEWSASAEEEVPAELGPESLSGGEQPQSQPHPDGTDAAVVARVLEIKSATKQKPAHYVQGSIYSALLDQFLSEEATPACRIETSILTQETAARSGDSLDPFELPTFSRHEWEFSVEQLLAADGPVDEILGSDLDELSFSIDRVCNNCAYQEACATTAVEDPTAPASLSLLGLDPSVQARLHNAGVTNIRDLSTLLPRQNNTHPTDEPPTLTLPPEQQRQLEETLPGSIHETVQRAQAVRGEIDPEYQSYRRPPAFPDKGWIPLPDDRKDGWGNIEGSNAGELIHVGLFVRPDTAINRVAALGACVYAEAHGEYITIGEVIDAVPNDPDVAAEVETTLLDRFCDQLFEAIETVGTALGSPEESAIHCYTYSDHETEFLAEGLDRHADTLSQARALRALCSLDLEGHTDVDQSMISPVQPIIKDHFALSYPSEGLLTVTDQFDSDWDLDTFDPMDGREDEPMLRGIFQEQFLNESVQYLDDGSGIRLHLADDRLPDSPAAAAAESDSAIPDGWYPIRKRSGGQFPIEYIWTVTPRHPGDSTPRLTPETVDEWNDGDSAADLCDVVSGFYYRTNRQEEPLQRRDVEYLVEQLSSTLLRLVQAIPYRDVYRSKEPIDVTSLADFEVPVSELPAAARDYLRMEFGNSREQTLEHYRQPLRDRTRGGRSMPIRCTAVEEEQDGSVTITGELAYDALFDDADTARQIAQQTRLRSGDGVGGGSWRLLTRMQSAASSSQPSSDPTATVNTGSSEANTETTVTGDASRAAATSIFADPEKELTVEEPKHIKHSPPVLVDEFDTEAGTISLRTFPHRFQSNYSEFRVDHCGWESPAGSNLDDSDALPAERDGYIAAREPVWIEPGDIYMLDPMVDDFGSQKTDYALQSTTIEENVLWQYLRRIRQGESIPLNDNTVVDPTAVDGFLGTLADADQCLEPNVDQNPFIRAVDRSLVPLHGPPGTGKTSGATAPALLARAYARAQDNESFVGIIVAPSHEAVDAVLDGTTAFLDDWRQTESGLENLQLVRVLPSTPPSAGDRVDDTTAAVDVTYANYHSQDGEETLQGLADEMFNSADGEADASQQLLFTTPSTLYRTLGIIAEQRSEINDDSAPAAMRYEAGLADVVCVDEASMLDIPQWLLAGSVLKPDGQSLLVGDHRQLATITETEWDETLRKPLAETKAYLSALEYVHWLNESVPVASDDKDRDPKPSHTVTDGGRYLTDMEQSELSGFTLTSSTPPTGGDDQ
ncbi:AAA family ATPase [Halonotius pteroides]|uniref:Uncharacterized protein n=1 Tax=Halonotius pteroides TaxID=268735 RepID=A0A3A6Q494_9EURY|nr:AAA family ATPase [Halonotius pteroides]RJX47848.1 hypothetical protein DP106_13900 [Halonotius pteroides]